MPKFVPVTVTSEPPRVDIEPEAAVTVGSRYDVVIKAPETNPEDEPRRVTIQAWPTP